MSIVTVHPGGVLSSMPRDGGRDRAVGLWLVTMACLVFAMVVVGGITRLTESGLSIVEWRPVTGVLPPLDAADWEAAFEAYKRYPEYRLMNRTMTLSEFKTIYWWEFAHRLLGRLIGLAYLLPLVVFWARKRIPRGYGPRLAGIFLLGALQGLMGWLMVKSGLVAEPEVSHYRLAAHLLLAVAIFAALVWTALDLLEGRRRYRDPVLRRWARAIVWLVVLQIALGGLVAGLKAGRVFNSWPMMDGSFLPPGGFAMAPWWTNFLDNAALVQFNHRLGAYAVTAAAFIVAIAAFVREAAPPVKASALLLLFLVVAQATGGVLALLAEVPVVLGAVHQGGALLVLAAALAFLHRYKPEPVR